MAKRKDKPIDAQATEEIDRDSEAVALNDKMTRLLGEASQGDTKAERKVKKANALYTKNEWTLDDTEQNDRELSLRIPKAVTETIIGSVLESRFEMEVVADEMPIIPPDHPFQQVLQQQAQVIATRSMDESKILSEMLTVALSALSESLTLSEITERVVEKALVEAHAYLKDGVSLYSRETLSISLIPRVRITRDPHAKCWDDVEWLCERIPTSKEELFGQFPEQKDQIRKALEAIGHDDDTGRDGKDGKKPELEEWWFRDRSMLEEDGVLVPKYPGFLKQAFRIGNLVLDFGENNYCRPNPFPHGRLPYHQLVGVVDPDNLDGLSLPLDILYGIVVGVNKATSMALHNLVETAKTQRLWQTDKLLEPEKIGDVSVTNLKTKPGEDIPSLDAVVKELVGGTVSPAFFQVADMLGSRISEISGASSLPAPGQKGVNDTVHSGFRKGQLRRRIKAMLESLCFNLVHNLIAFVDEEKSYRMMGVGASYLRFNPHILNELVTNFHARFTIQINDEELLPPDPLQRAKLTTMMMQTAGELADATGSPLSEAIGLLPNMPHRATLQRQVLRNEMMRERERKEAMARGEADPLQREIKAQAEKERKDAANEITKKVLQRLADADAHVGLAINASGLQDVLLRLDELPISEVQGALEMVGMLAQQFPVPTWQILGLSLTLRLQKLQAQMQAQMAAQQAQMQGVPG